MTRERRNLCNRSRQGLSLLSNLVLQLALTRCSSLLSRVVPVPRTEKILINLLQDGQRQHFKTALLSSSISPIDLESPEEREERMRLVRKIQGSFYRGDSEGLVVPCSSDVTILENVPLWRVQWSELPGYQNVLNCHVPHYTHMFRRILSGKKPWLFGHVYLPGGSENLSNSRYSLPDSDKLARSAEASDATLIGTLMQISDFEQLDDGRLSLIVQALDRFQVLYATQHVPYAIATIQLDPDQEFLGDSNNGQNPSEARLAAVQQADVWKELEFRPTAFYESKTSTPGMVGVSPLVNYNSDFVLPSNLGYSAAREKKDYLQTPQEAAEDGTSNIVKTYILQLEYKVWVSVDRMLRLLMQINPGLQIPVPSQMLGLLPLSSELGRAWPQGFRLEEYARQLQSNNALVGTSTKSRFVRVTSCRHYPALRRAQRLSYTIWILLDSLGGAPSKQGVLEETSIGRRLELALQKLEGVNDSLQEVLAQE